MYVFWEPPVSAVGRDGSEGTKPPSQLEVVCSAYDDATLAFRDASPESMAISFADGILTLKPLSS